MNDSQNTIAVVEAGDGFLLLGAEDLLTAFDSQSQLDSRKVTAQTLARAGHTLGVVGDLQAASGRWLKLTAESAEAVKKAGGGRVAAGVLRGKGGKITKHLKFENAALLTPAAPGALAALATQAALEAALDDIKEYLAAIDVKLDQLLKQRKIEVLGQLGGVTLAIEEASSIYAHTGSVSAVTWSKVQANSLMLQVMLAEAVAQLHSLADHLKERAKDTDRAAQALGLVQTDTTFWLGVLARTLALQDRQYVLELARVADDEPSQLESHHQGIRVARADRARRIAKSLDAINASVHDSAELTNLNRVANPFSAQQVTRGANSVSQSVSDFARHADVALVGADQFDTTPWSKAAKALLGGAGSRASSTGSHVANRARALGTQLQERGEDTLLTRAERIRDKRRGVREGAPALESEIETLGGDT